MATLDRGTNTLGANNSVVVKAVISVLVIAGFLVALFLLLACLIIVLIWNRPIPTIPVEVLTPVGMLLGVLGSKFGTAVDFWIGSSTPHRADAATPEQASSAASCESTSPASATVPTANVKTEGGGL